MVRVTLLYFAAVRDLTGIARESADVSARSIGELKSELSVRHARLRGQLGAVRWAKNQTFASDTDLLSEGDEIALIPPVAGG